MYNLSNSILILLNSRGGGSICASVPVPGSHVSDPHVCTLGTSISVHPTPHPGPSAPSAPYVLILSQVSASLKRQMERFGTVVNSITTYNVRYHATSEQIRHKSTLTLLGH